MSETTIVEKSKFDMLAESISSTVAPVATFIILILTFSVLLFFDKIDSNLYQNLVLSGAVVSAVMTLTKNNNRNGS